MELPSILVELACRCKGQLVLEGVSDCQSWHGFRCYNLLGRGHQQSLTGWALVVLHRLGTLQRGRFLG